LNASLLLGSCPNRGVISSSIIGAVFSMVFGFYLLFQRIHLTAYTLPLISSLITFAFYYRIFRL
jgi:hypothetical protein